MLKINSNNLISGYIKQLLLEFNLPKAKVLKKGMTLYKGGYYIHSNNLYSAARTCRYAVDGDFSDLSESRGFLRRISGYVYGKPYLNITKNLELSTPLYDGYTHAYLGDYLRFMRDYKNIDLMSMYNCFAGDIAHNIDETITIREASGGEQAVTTSFKSDDGEHIIYLVPARFGNDYTIAMDCEGSIEIAACFYAANQLTKMIQGTSDLNLILGTTTYCKKAGAQFGSPFKYEELKNALDTLSAYAETYYAHEKNLMLMVKVPVKNASSFVVLEGDYIAASEQTFKTSFSWDDNKDPAGNPALPVSNWYVLDSSTGLFTKVVDADTAYYDGNKSVQWLQRGVTYSIGSAGSQDTVTISDGVRYYSFSDVKNTINFHANNAGSKVKYYLHRSDFPEEPSKGDKSCVFFDEGRGLGYLWTDSGYALIKDEASGSEYSRVYSSRMQLLYVNDGNKYMFADKLIGYLIGNVISSDDSIDDNIRRLQKTFYYRKNPSSKPDYDSKTDKVQPIGYEYIPGHIGIWSQDLRDMTYDLLNRLDILGVAFDAIGFVDKDAERTLGDDLSYDRKGHVISGGIR